MRHKHICQDQVEPNNSHQNQVSQGSRCTPRSFLFSTRRRPLTRARSLGESGGTQERGVPLSPEQRMEEPPDVVDLSLDQIDSATIQRLERTHSYAFFKRFSILDSNNLHTIY